jgi:hypothetical protein
MLDPMDAIIAKLEPRDTRVSPIDQPQTDTNQPELQTTPNPDQPIIETNPVDPVTNTDTTATDTDTDTTQDELELELEKELDELEKLIFVNKEEQKKEITVPKVIQERDNQKLSLEDQEEIVNYIDELSEQLAEKELNFKRLEVERNQLETILEKERLKVSEFLDKYKELERENKKVKTAALPDDLQTLVDAYKLYKENPNSLYYKHNLVGEAMKSIVEPVTERKMDEYIIDRMKA